MKNLMTTAILAFMSLITFGQLNQVTSNPTYDVSLGDQIYLRYAVVGEENDVKVIKYDNNTNNITHDITFGSGIVTNHINHLEYGRFAIASQNQGLIVFGAYQENELFRINDTSYNGSNSYVNSAYASGHIMVTTGTDAKLLSFNEAEITIPVYVGSPLEPCDAFPYITANDSNFYYATGVSGLSNNMGIINHNLVQENALEIETTRLNENYFKTCNYYNIQGEEYIIFALSGTYATKLYKISDGSFVSLYTGLAEKIVDTKIHPITNNIFGLLDNGTIYEITNSNDIVNETSNYFNITGNVLNYTENVNVNDFGFDKEGNLWIASDNGLFTERVLQNTVSVEEQMLNNVSISPNPFSSEINLKNVPANLTYSISDLSGKIVDSGLTQNKLSLAHLENGMYVLKIEGYEVKRIIKK